MITWLPSFFALLLSLAFNGNSSIGYDDLVANYEEVQTYTFANDAEIHLATEERYCAIGKCNNKLYHQLYSEQQDDDFHKVGPRFYESQITDEGDVLLKNDEYLSIRVDSKIIVFDAATQEVEVRERPSVQHFFRQVDDEYLQPPSDYTEDIRRALYADVSTTKVEAENYSLFIERAEEYGNLKNGKSEDGLWSATVNIWHAVDGDVYAALQVSEDNDRVLHLLQYDNGDWVSRDELLPEIGLNDLVSEDIATDDTITKGLSKNFHEGKLHVSVTLTSEEGIPEYDIPVYEVGAVEAIYEWDADSEALHSIE